MCNVWLKTIACGFFGEAEVWTRAQVTTDDAWHLVADGWARYATE